MSLKAAKCGWLPWVWRSCSKNKHLVDFVGGQEIPSIVILFVAGQPGADKKKATNSWAIIRGVMVDTKRL
jgi:hypothetical protein